MWIDLIALALFAYFVGSGLCSGTLVSALRIVALLGGYIAALALGPVLAPAIGLALGVNDLFALVIAGTSLFIGVLVFFGLVTWSMKRARRRRTGEDEPLSGLDRAGGAFFGLAQGAIFVLLLGVLATWLEVAEQRGALGVMPQARGAVVANATQVVVERTAALVLDDQDAGARAAVRFAVQPDAALADLEQLIEDPALQRLQSDPLFWSYLEHGSVDQALNQGAFLEIIHNPDLRRRMADLGMIRAESVEDPALFRSEVRELFVQIAPRIRAVRQDPALQELASDPTIVEALQSGNTAMLLGDARVRSLVAQALETPSAEGVPAAPMSELSPEGQ